MKTPTLVTRNGNREVWSLYDTSAEVYELFAEPECECYVGCADTRAEARRVALDWLNEE
jgi:hypothetical protein